MSLPAAISCVLLLFGVLPVTAQERVPLGSLELGKLQQGWGRPKVDRSIEDQPLSIGGRSFEWGIGSHASSLLHLRLAGGTARFTAWVGVDDETGGRGSVVFRVYADGRKRFDSGVMRGGDPAQRIDIGLEGAQMFTLVTTSAGDGKDHDHADWAEAEFHVTGMAPEAVDPPAEPKVLLTPPPGPEPRLNGPLAVGIFNLGEFPRSLAVDWKTLGRSGPQRVRDLWRQVDVGRREGTLEVDVARHGVALLRLWAAP